MPRKNQRSQAQKFRRQKESQSKQTENSSSQDNLVFEKVSCADVNGGPHSDVECSAGQQVNCSDVAPSDESIVTKALQNDAQQVKRKVSQVSYADVVKKARVVAGPSHEHQVNVPQPSETHVCASRSQASFKYGKSRNRQCVANSLVFLAFLHENENIGRPDLDLVLDKGDVVYRQAQQKFPKSIHLATDELPHEVIARRSKYQVDLTEAPVCGSFGGGARYQSLEQALRRLSSGIHYGLLIMSALCIAVFKSRSGQYGFFDPHSRSKYGTQIASGLLDHGTAVMLKFNCLSDMIERIKLCFTSLGVQSSCLYELQPLSFNTEDPHNRRDVSDTTTTSALSDDAINESALQTAGLQSKNVIPEMLVDTDVVQQEVESTHPTHNFPACESNSLIEVLNPGVSDISDDAAQGVSNEVSCMLTVTEENVSVFHSSVVQKTGVLPGISFKLSKYCKKERYRAKRRLIGTQKSKWKENQKLKERQKYKKVAEFRERKRSYIQNLYRNDPRFQQRQKDYIRNLYRNDARFQQRQKDYIRTQYRNDARFQQRQKDYIRTQYRNDARFQQRQKDYIRTQYRNDARFQQRQKDYIRTQYRNDPRFQQRQKDYIRTQYRNDPRFRQRQRSYMTERYAKNKEFRFRNKNLMRQLMRN
ncbi:uncharacterized protein LOC119779575, partial [Cyprinodon tularosa]|uniref:uncharacterized protein LOC119779575 n=1 Tax=Cyprinodon tularosa TaxID=77115 RepID=UPI0018E22352